MKYKLWNRNETVSTKNRKKKSKAREWGEALIFAAVAATLIRLLFIEPYSIPSGSMKNSLLVGDFLFVSKLNYGPRMPITPVAFPFAHHTMPITGGKAYYDGIQWKYRRLPGFQSIKRNDVVVFNYPEGDTAMKEQQDMNYYQLKRQVGKAAIEQQYTLLVRPVDKRENFIKRCVAISGDLVSMQQGMVYVNGIAQGYPKESLMPYKVETNTPDVNLEVFKGLGFDLADGDISEAGPNQYIFKATQEQIAKVKQQHFVKSVTMDIATPGTDDPAIFPMDSHFGWNLDNFGPITVPAKGTTIKLDTNTLKLYKRCIVQYEKNTLSSQGNTILINGRAATSYTFKMNYYWMMGDNRHDSLDSRYWGFVPEDHIVGKALFIWLSINDHAESFFNKIRWKRLIKGI